MTTVKCPECGATMEVEVLAAQVKWTCKKCHKTVTLLTESRQGKDEKAV